MKRVCPEDLVMLEARELRGLTLDVCPKCAGIYFDEGEIAALQFDGPEALTEVEDAVTPGGLTFVESPIPKRCPGCQKPMHGYRYRYSSDIRLDGCQNCGGVWIQDGELGKIADYLQATPKTFGGTPAAAQAAESRNAEGIERNEAARRHASLLHRAFRRMG